jgi:hypothetical protein
MLTEPNGVCLPGGTAILGPRNPGKGRGLTEAVLAEVKARRVGRGIMLSVALVADMTDLKLPFLAKNKADG